MRRKTAERQKGRQEVRQKQADNHRTAGTASALVGASQEAIASGARATGATAADVAPVKGLAAASTVLNAAATASALSKEGHSPNAVAQGTTTSLLVGGSITGATTIGGSFLGGPPGGLIGGLLGAGIDAWTGASDKAGKAAAESIDSGELGKVNPRPFPY